MVEKVARQLRKASGELKNLQLYFPADAGAKTDLAIVRPNTLIGVKIGRVPRIKVLSDAEIERLHEELMLHRDLLLEALRKVATAKERRKRGI